MTLFLERKDSFFWPATVTEAVDGGKHRKHTFEVELKRVSQTRREELGRIMMLQQARIKAGRVEEEDADGKMVPIEILTPRQMADELWVGWRKVKDREGEGGEGGSGRRRGGEVYLAVPFLIRRFCARKS